MISKEKIIVIVFILACLNCSPAIQEDQIRWVTFEDISISLQNQPAMNVGFDIDDTVLFSSPAYYYGQQKYSPGSKDYLSNPEFHMELNNGLDNFSIPKEIARKLIAFHKDRGDNIFFITGRNPTETETLTGLLAKTFDLQNPNPVIFCGANPGDNPKIALLQENNIQIFYGDSDGDILAAQAIRIRAIRIIRADNSTHKPLPESGKLGEEVLVDSHY
ncbi:MAG: acid phosphatase AphA [Candidatus Aminicenantes bacterium]|nr:acid phosphatase AphA [Candidatus Aminicenantes bacterium]